MSFLKKILGIVDTPEPREKVPRAPRIPLKNIHRLIMTSPRWNGQVMNVLNISTTGIAVEITGKSDDIERGSVIPAMITLNLKTFPILLRVAQITDALVGCAFEGDVHELQKAIFDYFVAEISGMEVTEVNSKLLKPDTRGDAHWYFGANNSEIYFTRKDSQMTYFHITLLGNYIECYSDQPPKFGYIVTQEGQNKMKPDQSPLIRFTEQISESTVDLFIKFVNHVASVKKDDRTMLLDVLEELKADQHSKNLQI